MTRYKFKGYTITNCGYHQPDHCVWWEAVDENGEACFHGNTLREVEFEILDHEWEQKMREKDEEIERLKLRALGDDAAAATTEKSSAVGNAAAMREALMEIRDICLRVGANISPTSKKYQSRECQTIFACFRKTAAALSAPPRNCDVGTAEEQARRFHAFCRQHRAFDAGCSANCPCEKCCDINHCQSAWGQMPYEAKEG